MKKLIFFLLLSGLLFPSINAQEKPQGGADEKTPSRSLFFSWINNTNEGATARQTQINLDFFKWLHDKYGMQLDIYAFVAGAIDGAKTGGLFGAIGGGLMATSAGVALSIGLSYMVSFFVSSKSKKS